MTASEEPCRSEKILEARERRRSLPCLRCAKTFRPVRKGIEFCGSCMARILAKAWERQ